MRIDFIIKNDMLVLERQRDTFSGNVNFYECYFDIQTNRELVWICVFKKGNEAYQQVIENGICMIPAEVLMGEGKLEIGCYASDNAEKFQRISTNWVSIHVSNGAYSEGTAPKIPEKDVWETLVLKGIPYIGENGNWYIFDTEQMGYVDSGRTAKGEKGEKGDRGETGLAGNTGSANALVGKAFGEDIVLDDVSSVEHFVAVKVKSKNIVPYPYETGTTTISGVTFTVNDDGTIYVSGTNNGTSEISFRIHVMASKKLWPEIGNTYTLTGCPSGGSVNTFYLMLSAGSGVQSVRDDGNGAKITIAADEAFFLHIRIKPGVTVDNTFRPQVEEGETATEYTPYVADVSDVMVEVSDENGRFEEVYSQENGSVANVISSYPSMAVRSSHPGVVLDVTYNRDINKAFAELTEKFTNAIISLGGNV